MAEFERETGQFGTPASLQHKPTSWGTARLPVRKQMSLSSFCSMRHLYMELLLLTLLINNKHLVMLAIDY